MSEPPRPGLIRTGWAVAAARWRRRPRPHGTGSFDHGAFQPVLDAVAAARLDGVIATSAELDAYRAELHAVDPDGLTRNESLAYWINLNNAEALSLVGAAVTAGLDSVLHLKGGFGRKTATIAGERLSLADIEHGKIRRFGDPRIHTALVCGSLSCPTLRSEPFTGAGLDRQLDDQMRQFLTAGGVVAEPGSGVVTLSRIFMWYGADFVRPARMPTLLPAPRRRVLAALEPWLPAEVVTGAARPEIRFADYDWALGCSIA